MRSQRRTWLSLVCSCLAFATISTMRLAAQERASRTVGLTLPTTLYAVPGVEVAIYFDNVVLIDSGASVGTKIG